MAGISLKGIESSASPAAPSPHASPHIPKGNRKYAMSPRYSELVGRRISLKGIESALSSGNPMYFSSACISLKGIESLPARTLQSLL